MQFHLTLGMELHTFILYTLVMVQRLYILVMVIVVFMKVPMTK